MKTIKILPEFLGVKAMAIYPFILTTKNARITDVDINHEKIHLRQQREMFVLPFYILYLIEWVYKSIKMRKDAYYWISYEQEAYMYEHDFTYLDRRKRTTKEHNTRVVFGIIIISCLILLFNEFITWTQG